MIRQRYIEDIVLGRVVGTPEERAEAEIIAVRLGLAVPPVPVFVPAPPVVVKQAKQVKPVPVVAAPSVAETIALETRSTVKLLLEELRKRR